ncbi:Folylpolyglutamate synthase [Corynebacterium glaucum]|uniref:tetrahydrofolate synthase n=1 Tax=Corynebacterium glaucum TaxID=187491 RepID=A0A1Q2HYJ7_9CORY|nr:folylpolyglutamate synthase/dihydrofolate synthase family protein [Corynebacterium glaucum]AQQ15904.1 Folylpolyglutamate synthase [Corynebacterium glaucum]
MDNEYRAELTEHGITMRLNGPVETGEEAGERTVPAEPETHPDFEDVVAQLDARAGAVDPNPSLERIAMLMDLLGEPQRSFAAIHVAGTNGKTSTARMSESILRALGRRTGLFTSPEMTSLTECIVIDGEEISQTRFVETYRDIEPYIDMVDAQFDPGMSRFEVLVGIAYAAFAEAPVDVAVVEVGMGGTWDATNVIDADVSVITPVGMDHQAFLGETVSEIAAQKAGIIAPGERVAVVAEQDEDAMHAILERAVEVDAAVARAGRDFTVGEAVVAVGGQQLTLNGLGGTYDDVFLPLAGAHQAANASVALAAVEAFFGASSEHPLDADAVREGLGEVTVPGRLERVHVDPIVLVDAAHNPAGADSLAATMQRDFNFQSVIGVVSIYEDKDARSMLTALEPVCAELVITRNHSPRAMEAHDLGEIAADIFGDYRVRVEEHLGAALELAIELAEEDGPEGGGVLVTGSIATAGEARAYLRARKGE